MWREGTAPRSQRATLRAEPNTEASDVCSPARLLASVQHNNSARSKLCASLLSLSATCFSSSAFRRSCRLTDGLASPARQPRWPQAPSLLLLHVRIQGRARERAHLQGMGTGKAPGSGAGNQAGDHCSNFSLHGNKENPDYSLSF